MIVNVSQAGLDRTSQEQHSVVAQMMTEMREVLIQSELYTHVTRLEVSSTMSTESIAEDWNWLMVVTEG